MAKIPKGCQLIARQIQESKIWVTKPDWWFKIWIHIILEVNHSDNKYFKRGTNMFNYKDMKDNCYIRKVEARSIEHVIQWLRKEQMIETHKTTRGLIITVVKYEHFQNMDNYKSDTESDTESDTKREMKATQKLHRSYTINNNDKNVKNDKNKDIKVFIDYFFTEYQKKFNIKYIVNGGKDGSIAQNLLKHYDILHLKELINIFLNCSDAFIAKAGYTIGVFNSQINKLEMMKNGKIKDSIADRERRLQYVSTKKPVNI